MTHSQIHEKAITLAKNYQQSEIQLLEILQLVNREKVYRTLGYTSLFTYAVEALSLPPERVYQLNVVAKKCEEVPELKTAIQTGVLNVSKARRIVSVIQKESSSDWIDKAASLTQRQLEKEVARVNPKEAVPEKTKVLNAQDALISLSISIEAKEQLDRLRDVLSQKEKRPFSLRDVVEYLALLGIEKIDPLKKAERNAEKPVLSSRTKNRRYIPTPIKHKVLIRDNGRCTHVANGRRCENRRWIQVHHKRPVQLGGLHSVENLTLLCAAHHRIHHDPSL